MENIVKTNTGWPKKDRKKPAENILAKIFKRLGGDIIPHKKNRKQSCLSRQRGKKT